MTPDLAAVVERLNNESEHHIGRSAHGNSLSVQELLLEAADAIETLASARDVQDVALACLRNDFRECALRAERAEAELATTEVDRDRYAREANSLQVTRNALHDLLRGMAAQLREARLGHDWLTVSNVECAIDAAIAQEKT